jgi:hypothetical protein
MQVHMEVHAKDLAAIWMCMHARMHVRMYMQGHDEDNVFTPTGLVWAGSEWV